MRCRQVFAIEEGWRLVIEQNKVCGAHISLKTGLNTPLMLKLTVAEHLSAVLFEGFSAFFDEDGLTPIKAKKSEITERVRRQAAGVRPPSALKRGLDTPLMLKDMKQAGVLFFP